MDNFRDIKKETEEFFKRAKLNISLEVKRSKEESISVEIRTEEPKLLVGHQGQALADIQKLLNLFLMKKFPAQRFFVNLDVNGYKEKKAEYLREAARTAADEAVISGQEQKLGPLPAFERKVIHMELSERNNVETESAGKEPERSVVIRPL